ncbi:MAG TPA: response regulator transcription factor [Chitinophagaceae bacterium]|nr:response regulator transcription factor [Chitinophagaceae bacterium]
MTEIKILIVEDEPIIAEDILSALEKNEFQVSAIAYDMQDAMYELEHNTPDLALLDINLNGDQEGIMIANKISKEYHLPFVFLTSYSDKGTLEKAKHTEPSGYIVKPFSEASLYSTIEIALYNFAQKNKKKFPDLSLLKINKSLSDPLSEREFELIQLIYEGCTNQQIADQLFISLNTVKKHINHMYLKLDSHSRSSTIARLRALMMQV